MICKTQLGNTNIFSSTDLNFSVFCNDQLVHITAMLKRRDDQVARENLSERRALTSSLSSSVI
jgi:hypothetical protein